MRYFLIASYRGTNYHGWQIQSNVVTVQEILEDKLSLLCKEKVSIMGSGRTDTGVHAEQQGVHFDVSRKIENIQNFVFRLNEILPIDIAISACKLVSPEFNARFDVKYRKYIYRISRYKKAMNQDKICLFYKNLDFDAMNSAAQLLLLHRDYQAFSKVKTEVNHFECTIEKAEWILNKDVWEFHIQGNRFLRGMVRAIVGTLYEVGLGRKTVEDFGNVIKSKNRNLAGNAARPEGLCLEEVIYKEECFDLEFYICDAQSDHISQIRTLYKDYQRELGISLEFQDFENELSNLPKPYTQPKGGLWIAISQNNIIGTVAIKLLEEGICEMKRLIVLPKYRGYGIGRRLTEYAMLKAKEYGYSTLKLDTLARLLPAKKMYESLGFQETEPYNFNPQPDILYFSKTL
ncbi:MAG: tRNA pseudouridine(38-40) synthase TruA [Leadbetterella sp.]